MHNVIHYDGNPIIPHLWSITIMPVIVSEQLHNGNIMSMYAGPTELWSVGVGGNHA